jgi:hypothetical protein
LGVDAAGTKQSACHGLQASPRSESKQRFAAFREAARRMTPYARQSFTVGEENEVLRIAVS